MIFLAKVVIHFKKNGWDLLAAPVFRNTQVKNSLIIGYFNFCIRVRLSANSCFYTAPAKSSCRHAS